MRVCPISPAAPLVHMYVRARRGTGALRLIHYVVLWSCTCTPDHVYPSRVRHVCALPARAPCRAGRPCTHIIIIIIIIFPPCPAAAPCGAVRRFCALPAPGASTAGQRHGQGQIKADRGAVGRGTGKGAWQARTVTAHGLRRSRYGRGQGHRYGRGDGQGRTAAGTHGQGQGRRYIRGHGQGRMAGTHGQG